MTDDQQNSPIQTCSQIQRANLNQQARPYSMQNRKKLNQKKIKNILISAIIILVSIAFITLGSVLVVDFIVLKDGLIKQIQSLKADKEKLQQKLTSQIVQCHAWLIQKGQQCYSVPPQDTRKSNYVPKNPLYVPTSQQLSKLQLKKDLIVSTQAGRKAYLQLLYNHLSKQVDKFSKWHIWVNTNNKTDIEYIEKLGEQNNWIKVVKIAPPKVIDSFSMIYFYKQDCQKNKIYLKLDDDILWIEPNFVQKMFNHRLKLTQHLLIFSNIINSVIHSHIQQRVGVFKYPELIHNNCNGNGWSQPQIGAEFHKQFLQSLQKGDIEKWRSYKDWVELEYGRVSINAIMYYSQTIRSLNFIESQDDEYIYTQVYAKAHKMPVVLIGDAICVHGAFYTQRQYFNENHPQIFQKYKQIADKLRSAQFFK